MEGYKNVPHLNTSSHEKSSSTSFILGTSILELGEVTLLPFSAIFNFSSQLRFENETETEGESELAEGSQDKSVLYFNYK